MSEPETATIEPQSTASSARSLSSQKGLYTVQEAAAKLNLSPSWLYARTRKNEIRFRRLGKYIRFTDEDLDAIIGGATSQKTVMERGV